MRKLRHAGVLAAALGLAGCAPEALRPPPEAALPARTYAAPSFSVPALTAAGERIAIGSYTGRVVLLDFWATWCPACRWELPRLDRLSADLKDQDFELVGMVVDEAPEDELADVVKGFDLSFPVGVAGPEIQEAYGGIRAVPTKFLLGRDGRIHKAYQGVVPIDQLRADVEAVLAL